MAEIGLKLVCAYPKYVGKSELEHICKDHGVSSLKDRLKAFREHPHTFEIEESDDSQSVRVKLIDRGALLASCR